MNNITNLGATQTAPATQGLAGPATSNSGSSLFSALMMQQMSPDLSGAGDAQMPNLGQSLSGNSDLAKLFPGLVAPSKDSKLTMPVNRQTDNPADGSDTNPAIALWLASMTFRLPQMAGTLAFYPREKYRASTVRLRRRSHASCTVAPFPVVAPECGLGEPGDPERGTTHARRNIRTELIQRAEFPPTIRSVAGRTRCHRRSSRRDPLGWRRARCLVAGAVAERCRRCGKHRHRPLDLTHANDRACGGAGPRRSSVRPSRFNQFD